MITADEEMTTTMTSPATDWPRTDTAHVPYSVFTDLALFELEQDRVFRGPTWNYVGLEAEVSAPGDYLSSSIGTTPVVLTRDRDGRLHVLVNRCAHRGAPVVREARGNSSLLKCLYHDWSYGLDGRLKGVPFRKGVNGCPGYDECVQLGAMGMRPLRTEALNGLVFATFGDAAPTLEDYLGAALGHITRVFDGRALQVLGYLRQRVQANWKLYFENTKDPYHASLLHHFHSTFGLYRSTMRGDVCATGTGVAAIVAHGGTDEDRKQVYENGEISSYDKAHHLQAPGLLDAEWEYGDHITTSIHTIFPSVVTQQIANTLATRRLVPLGVDSFELRWTFVGYAGDSAELRQRRLHQANLIGPSGYISLEDTEVLEVLQRAISDGTDDRSLVAMGGDGVEVDRPVEGLISENAIRAFWQTWRDLMEV